MSPHVTRTSNLLRSLNRTPKKTNVNPRSATATGGIGSTIVTRWIPLLRVALDPHLKQSTVTVVRTRINLLTRSGTDTDRGIELASIGLAEREKRTQRLWLQRLPQRQSLPQPALTM
jgi:hypothetical protein